jgi:uncharacterized Rmd1/YagE family protein
MQTAVEWHPLHMKQLVLFLIVLSAGTNSFAQQNTRHYDSLARKAVERFTAHPDCDACNVAGIVLLKLFKANDSVQIKVLYASEEMYNIEHHQNLPRWLNKKYKDSFENNYGVLVPVYFRYQKENSGPPEVSAEQKEILKKQIGKYGCKMNVTEPAVIIGYAPVR